MSTTNGMTSEALRLKGYVEVPGNGFLRAPASRPPSVHPQAIKTLPAPSSERTGPSVRRVRQSKKGMNRLESQFYQQLLCEFPPSTIRIQAVTLKIGNGVRFSPDFFVFHEGEMIAFECKGSHAWDDSLVKLKVAASVWPEIYFVLAWKRKGDGSWARQTILA